MSEEQKAQDPTGEMRKAFFSMTVTFVKSLEDYMSTEDAKEFVASYLEDLASTLRPKQEEEGI